MDNCINGGGILQAIGPMYEVEVWEQKPQLNYVKIGALAKVRSG